MSARSQVLEAINELEPQDLLRVAEFIAELHDKKTVRSVPNANQPDYLAVRRALQGIKNPMSGEIIDQRDDRI